MYCSYGGYQTDELLGTSILMMDRYGIIPCRTEFLHFLKNIARSRDLLPLTQLYFPPNFSDRNRLDGSSCRHWSPPSTQRALQLLDYASFFDWPFQIYSLCISIINLFFISPCIYSSSFSHSFCLLLFGHLACLPCWQDRQCEPERMREWEKINAKIGEEKIYYGTCREFASGRANRKQTDYVITAMTMSGGWWTKLTWGFVNPAPAGSIGRQVNFCWWK